AERRGSDEHGAPGLADGERGTGVDADERLLEHDGPRLVLLQQLDDAVEDRLQAQLRTAPGGRLPPAVVDRPEAPAFLVDDAVTACCRTRIDAQDLHGATLRTGSDGSSYRRALSRVLPSDAVRPMNGYPLVRPQEPWNAAQPSCPPRSLSHSVCRAGAGHGRLGR